MKGFALRTKHKSQKFKLSAEFPFHNRLQNEADTEESGGGARGWQNLLELTGALAEARGWHFGKLSDLINHHFFMPSHLSGDKKDGKWTA